MKLVGECMAYSPWPADVMLRSHIDATVAGSVLCARFADHRPDYRQSEGLARHGVELVRNTLCSLVRLAEEKLRPTYEAVVAETLASGYLMMNPTPLRLKSGANKGATKEACLRTYRALDGPVFFEFAVRMYGTTPVGTLQHYQGILRTDGASNFGVFSARGHNASGLLGAR